MSLVSSGFGTNNLIFVPEDEVLSLWDIQSWTRMRLDTRRLTVRPRQATLDQITMDVEEALSGLSRAAKRKKAKLPDELRSRADTVLNSLEGFIAPEAVINVRMESPGLAGMTWWVRITDAPTESYFPEDYVDAPVHPTRADAFPVFGSMTLERLGTLDIPFPADGAGAAFFLLIPEDAIQVESIPAEEPLPLIREYCGVNGVSAHGHSVNIDTISKITANHSGCTPLSRVGSELFATLYFHLQCDVANSVCAALPTGKAPVVLEVLDRSRFEIISAAEPGRLPAWCILRREEDVVHIYHGLEGKESEGHHTMPDLVVVTRAGGTSDPELRSQLLQQILGVTR
jgi:hypothetical protein